MTSRQFKKSKVKNKFRKDKTSWEYNTWEYTDIWAAHLVVDHIYQLLRVTSQASYSPEYTTPTQQISWLLDYTDIEGTRLSSEISHLEPTWPRT
jgi:hypothetical protein